MLLVGRIVQPHGDEDEEDQERPHNLHQELKLRVRRRQEAFIAMATLTHVGTSISVRILFKMSSEDPFLVNMCPNADSLDHREASAGHHGSIMTPDHSSLITQTNTFHREQIKQE